MASALMRGTGEATAGSKIRAVAVEPGSLGYFARFTRALSLSAWARPALKLALLVMSLGVLAWVGTNDKLPGWPAPARAAGSAPSPAASSVGARETFLVLRSDSGAAEAPARSAPDPAPAPSAPVPGVLPDGRVVLNTASEQELQKLPRVGASRARAIVALRGKLGRFRTPRDLLRIKGIGPKTLQKLQPHLVLDPPDAGAGEN